MATKTLAKQLGSVRKRSQSSTGQRKPLVSNQIFSYLIVIDYESTCWREKNNYGPEIIEFPAVLLNTSTGEVESEFHTYVQPQEHPVLSEFCTELTGITQGQVEAGVPLHICLGRFSRWLQALQLQKGVAFPRDQRGSAPSASKKPCAFVTWSDWDLGVCLQYECKRKQLHKPDVLNSWIDLRATYKSFYNKKPKGLNGALQDLGIQFSGREHSGLDDARNTAQLALRMMQDGCVMKITRSQDGRPLQTKPLLGNANNHVASEKEKEKVLATAKTSSCKTPESCQHKPCSESHNMVVDTKKTSHSIQELAQDVQSLISPRTLLNGVTTPLYGNSSSRSKIQATTNLSSGMVINNMSLRNNSKSLILVSTTVDCLPHLPQLIQSSESKETVVVQQEERAKFVAEMDEGCGSYDAVVFECDDVINNLYTKNGMFDITNASECGSRCSLIREKPKISVWSRTKLQSINCMAKESKTKKPENCTARRNMSTPTNKEGLYHFATPKTFNQNTKSLASTSNHLAGANGKASQKRKESGTSHNESRKLDSSLRPMSFVSDKTHALFMGPRSVLSHQNRTRTHSKMHKELVKTSFAIFTDTAKHSALSHSSSYNIQQRRTPSPSILSSLSTNHSGAAAPTSRRITCKVTSPLCACGRRSKRQIVANGGPNHGRGFYCCPVRRSGSGNGIQKGCEFFKWESALIQGHSKNTAASSVSLCFNSSLYRHAQHTSNLRKSY